MQTYSNPKRENEPTSLPDDDLVQAAKGLADRIWRAERPGVEPDAARLAGVVSAAIRKGHMSFRRVVNGMEELLGE